MLWAVMLLKVILWMKKAPIMEEYDKLLSDQNKDCNCKSYFECIGNRQSINIIWQSITVGAAVLMELKPFRILDRCTELDCDFMFLWT
jgi:hypothetical protein